jgi:hypothetical protein
LGEAGLPIHTATLPRKVSNEQHGAPDLCDDAIVDFLVMGAKVHTDGVPALGADSQ